MVGSQCGYMSTVRSLAPRLLSVNRLPLTMRKETGMTGLRYLNPPSTAFPQLSPLASVLGASSLPRGQLSGLAAVAIRSNPYELVTKEQTVTLERRVWDALDRRETVNVPLFRP